MKLPKLSRGLSRLVGWVIKPPQETPTFFAKILPYAAIAVIALVAVGAALLLGISTAFVGLIIVGIPVILAAIICISKVLSLRRETSSAGLTFFSMKSYHFVYMVLLFAILYVLSLGFLFHGGPRPLIYFVFIALMVAVASLQILSIDTSHRARPTIILVQIILLILNLIYGQTLNLPLFFGGGDLLRHMDWINTIIGTGHITSAIGGWYEWFPLFHVFGAEGVLISGMGLQTSYFIIFGAAYATTVFIVYLLVKTITKDNRLSLLATLFYAITREVTFNGMYINTREMAFIFCLAILYLLLQKKWRFRIIAIFLVIVLIPLHTTSLAHFSMILGAIIVIEMIMFHRSQFIGSNFLLLFMVGYIGYWILFAYPFFHDMVLGIVPSDVISAPIQSGIATSNLINTALRNLDYIILGFLVFVGVIFLLRQEQQEVNLRHVFALFALPAFVVFIPDIAAIISPLLLAYRLALLVSPVIAMATAAGITAFLSRTWQSKPRTVVPVIATAVIISLVAIYSFSSQVLDASQTDLNLSAIGSTSSPRYFTEGELASFNTLAQYQKDIPIYTDVHTSWYLEAKYKVVSNGTTDTLEIGNTRNDGLLVFREQAFEERGMLVFDPSSASALYHGTQSLRKGQKPDLQAIWGNYLRIYADDDVQIYLK